MKRILVVILVVLLGFSMLTSCSLVETLRNIGSKDTPTSSGDKVSEDNDKTDDPCPCCPNCIEKDCECIDCGDSNNCECMLPSGNGPFMFKVEIDSSLNKDYRSEMESNGYTAGYSTRSETVVTLNESNDSGWFGIGNGNGEYYDCWGGPSSTTYLDWEKGYQYTVKLSNFNPSKADSITVGINQFAAIPEIAHSSLRNEDDEIIGLSAMIEMCCEDIYDEGTGLYMFNLTMDKGGIATIVDTYEFGGTGKPNIIITITVTMLK